MAEKNSTIKVIQDFDLSLVDIDGFRTEWHLTPKGTNHTISCMYLSNVVDVLEDSLISKLRDINKGLK